MTELDPEARALINLARDGEGPTASERGRVRSALLTRIGAVVAVTTAATGTAAASTQVAAGASTLVLASKIVIAVALVGSLGVGGYALHRGSSVAADPGPAITAATAAVTPQSPASAPRGFGAERRAVAAPTTSASPPSAAVFAAPVPAVPPSSPKVTEVALPAERPAVRAIEAVRSESSSGSTASAPSSGTIEAETVVLRDALADIRDGRAERALALLDAQAAELSAGPLAEECAETRIVALCALGRTEEAHADATRFLARYPHSLHAARVSASCGGPRQ